MEILTQYICSPAALIHLLIHTVHTADHVATAKCINDEDASKELKLMFNTIIRMGEELLIS